MATIPEERVYRLPGGVEIAYDRLTEAERAEADVELAEFAALVRRNPLMGFEWHPAEEDPDQNQRRFLDAMTAVVAAFAGNQFGKSTILVVKALINALPTSALPERFRHLKQFPELEATDGWILCPTEDKIFDSLKPAILKWCGAEFLLGGSWGKAFNGERMMLTFACGSTIAFKTYKQEPSTLGGATLHWVGYDEPPPRAHRDEAATRLLAHNGPEWYAMTPLNTNTGWIRRDLWRNREAPHITVVRGSMHNNPALNKEAVARQLASYKNDLWRAAREFGDFMDQAGLIYAQFERNAQWPTPSPGDVRGLDNVWSIDPGIRNAAIVCGGFDQSGVDHVYDEVLIQDGTPTTYVQRIDAKLARWGLKRADVQFVIDPAARQRAQVTTEVPNDTVQTELTRLGIYTTNAANNKEVGQQQVRDRLLHGRLRVSKGCVGLRDEADEFAWDMNDADDDSTQGAGDDSPYHRLACLRYQVMARPFYAEFEAAAPQRNLGFVANHSFDLSGAAVFEAHPFGAMI